MHAMASQATTSDVYTRPVLLKVTVEVTATKSDMILVREGDHPAGLAAEFCRKHGLRSGLIQPLTAHIQENLDLALATTPLSPGSYGSLQSMQAQSQPVNTNSSGPLPAPGSALHRSSSQERRARVPVPSAADRAIVPAQASRSARQSFPGQTEPVAANLSEPVSTIDGALPPGPGCVSVPGSATRNGRLDNRLDHHEDWDHRHQAQARANQLSAASRPTRRLSTGRPASARATSNQRAAVSSAPTTPRYERLHEDAAQRQCRLQRLRQQVERQQEELCLKSGAQTPPGTLRSHAWHRETPRHEGGFLGERLYRDAEDRRIRMERMQLQRNLEQRLSDMEDVTFRPAIYRSQRACRGVPRVREDSAERLSKDGPTARRREQLKLLQLTEEMTQCTFQPRIDPRSAEMMEEKLRRIQWNGTLHEALYEDALRRRRKQAESESTLPEGATFQPSIGNSSRAGGVRPTPRDASEEDFFHRLAYEKAHRLAAKQQEEMQKQEASVDSSFRPSVGRRPLVERHGQQVPIGDFLFEDAREKASQQLKREELEAQQVAREAGASHVSDASRTLFEESKLRRYHVLFSALTDRDPDGVLRVETANLDALDQDLDLLPLLKPTLRSLSASGAAMRFEEFAACLDEHRRVLASPTAGAVARRPSKPGAGQSTSSVSMLSARREGSRTRGGGGGGGGGGEPLHEQLHRERELREQRLQEQRVQKQQEELAQCSFQPFRPPPRGNASASPPPPNGTARRSQSAGPGGSTARRATQRQQQQQEQQKRQAAVHQSSSSSSRTPRLGSTPRPDSSSNDTNNRINHNSNTNLNKTHNHNHNHNRNHNHNNNNNNNKTHTHNDSYPGGDGPPPPTSFLSQPSKSTPPPALVRQLLQAAPPSTSGPTPTPTPTPQHREDAEAASPPCASPPPAWREARERDRGCTSPSSATTVGPAIVEVSVAEFGREHLSEVDAAVNRARLLLSMTRDSS